ncbi:phage tail tip lysozyme [Brevibacillus laterosporus]|uniref:phage tail tip lysozyme n=1 Tax=Brevibacillus laterosporus TaxID=1465 RepID=UPI000839D0AB|nr:phage tail tip lysozyme [Brevibacillus laterosporus]
MTTAVSTRPVIKIGSKGPEVAKIQTALQNAGFSPGRIDSVFGSKTDQAVRYLQIDHHLKVDGIVGKDTWDLLQKYSKPTQGVAVNTTPQVIKYKIQQGDSLWLIAKKYNVDVEEIKKANPNINEKNLQIGQELNIPSASEEGGLTPLPDSSPSGDRFKTAWKFFKSEGFSDGATAGIMGNLKHESPNMDPHQIQGNDEKKPGRGICQWETKYAKWSSKYSGRWENLVAWAKHKGKDEYALNTQLEFLLYELKGGDSETERRLQKYGGVEGLKQLGIEEAVKAFQWSFERAGDPDYSSRIKYAYEIYKRFA